MGLYDPKMLWNLPSQYFAQWWKKILRKTIKKFILPCQISEVIRLRNTVQCRSQITYVTHFLLFFDHPPTHSNALAIVLLMTYNTKVCCSNAFANHPPTPAALRNMWTAPYKNKHGISECKFDLAFQYVVFHYFDTYKRLCNLWVLAADHLWHHIPYV